MPTRFNSIFETASSQTASIANLFLFVLLVCAVILAIVVCMIVTNLIRFRHRAGRAEPKPCFGNRKWEITWTVAPTLVIIWLFILAARGMHQSDPPADRKPDIIVTAHQWWWEIRYSQNALTANEIHIPAGRKFLVRLESADVIHNFWIPALARKIQAIPGRTNQIWLEAGAPGKYGGLCAEYCGAGHAWMFFSVIAETPDAFDQWLGGQENSAAVPAADPERNGLRLFQTMTCVNCHSIRGVSIAANTAPDLTHFASRQLLGAGVLPNTGTNIFRWLKSPQAVKPGCFMPDLKLTDEDAEALTHYLESLK